MMTRIKKQNIIQLGLFILIIIFINIISSFVYTRIDLTSEKRYTLSPATKKLLKELDDIVFFKVYLEGEFPAGFKRLRNSTKEMLDEFRAYSENIQYEFINPSEGKNKKSLSDIYSLLVEKGLQPTNLQVNKNDASSQQIIFPGALVSYRDKELPLQLLMPQFGSTAETQLNNSVQSLEYNISNAIRKLSVKTKPNIAFITGHGELDKFSTADAIISLQEYYNVDRVFINGKINSLRTAIDTAAGVYANKYKTIIIAQPDSVFNEKDKFIIDQHLMNGGRILWLVDPLFASQDSLQKSPETYAVKQQLNLEDMLYKYGVRLNDNLLMDLNALPIPVKTGDIGGQPQFSFLPWFYFPLITPRIKHQIVNNINAIKTEFISTLDTVYLPSVKKTILLTGSTYCRTVKAPVRVSLEILMNKPDESQYNNRYLPVAVLLEGRFSSLYKNRLTDEINGRKEISFKSESEMTSMIVVADGDIIKNQLRTVNGRILPYPLGYDRYTQQTFGNKEFILNCVNYLCDDSGLMSVRSRETQIRMLDKTTIEKKLLFIKLTNLLLPILIITITGITFSIIRKNKYSKQKN